MSRVIAALAVAGICLSAGASLADDMPELCDRGLEAAQIGAIHLAIENYTRCLNEETLTKDQKETVLNNRAVFYQMTNQAENALADRDQIVALFPGRAESFFIRGQLRATEMGDRPGAIADFDRALEIDPAYTEALVARGVAYENLGQQGLALQNFDRALTIAPKRGDALNYKADILRDQGQLTEALQLYGAVPESDPFRAEAYAGAGVIYRSQARWPLALVAFTRAIDIQKGKGSPSAGFHLLQRGDTYLAMQDYAKALADYSESLRLLPQVPWSLQRRAEVYEKMGQGDRALADLRQAQARFRSDPDVTNDLGDLLCRRGDMAAARAEWAKAESYLNTPVLAGRIHRQRQEMLKRTGFYSGPIDGDFGSGSQAAETAWANAGCPAS